VWKRLRWFQCRWSCQPLDERKRTGACRGAGALSKRGREAATESADNGFFFASAAPGVATTVTVAEELTKTDADYAKEYGMEGEDAPEEPQFESPGADPQPVLSRDYAADFTQTQHETTETAEPAVQTAPSLFAGPEHQTERDLDVPTFLRRLNSRTRLLRINKAWTGAVPNRA